VSTALAATLAAELRSVLRALADEAAAGDIVLLTDDPYLPLAGETSPGAGLWEAPNERIAVEPSTREGWLAHPDWECRWRRLSDGRYRTVLVADDPAAVERAGAAVPEVSWLRRDDLVDPRESQRLLLGRREGDGAFREGRVPYELPYRVQGGAVGERLALRVVEYRAGHPGEDDPVHGAAFVRFAGLVVLAAENA